MAVDKKYFSMMTMGVEAAESSSNNHELDTYEQPKESRRRPNGSSVRVQLGLILAMMLSLFLISSSGTTNVAASLNQHLPSARIFRALLEINLALWMSTLCLFVWWRIRMPVDELLFHSSYLLASWGWVDHHNRGGASAADSYTVTQSYEDGEDDLELTETTTAAPSSQIDDAQRDDAHHAGSDTTEAQSDNQDLGRQQQPMDVDDESQPLVHVRLCHTSLRMTLTILVALFFFVLASNGDGESSSNDNSDNDSFWKSNHWLPAAPLFSLGLLLYCCGHLMMHIWRHKVWDLIGVTLQTLWAPSCPVDFRDGLVGDIFTSLVRPLQDVSYTMFYLVFGLQGWWSSTAWKHYGNGGDSDSNSDNSSTLSATGSLVWNATKEVGQDFVDQASQEHLPALETSWLLHTVILPMCLISPLWYRYLQNLRQTNDMQVRWPYLGNAAKYFCAAQVAVWGMYHPDGKNSFLWLLCFALATLYQIWWDVVMDWGLIEFNVQYFCFWSLNRNNKNRRGRRPAWKWRVRSRRLYPTLWYILIGAINVILRFGWTLSFIPTKYLSEAHVLETRFGSWQTVLSWSLGSAEIIRRALWALLRMEWEILKTNESFRGSPVNHAGSGGDHTMLRTKDELDDDERDDDDDESNLELTPMPHGASSSTGGGSRLKGSSSNDVDDNLLVTIPVGRRVTIGELVVYAMVFWLLGTITAAHRGTL